MSLVEIYKEDRISIVEINRADALNIEVLDELDLKINTIKEDTRTDVVVITGAGESAFVSGIELNSISSQKEASSIARKGQKLCRNIQEMPQPTIAAVNGLAVGGGFELAMACDIRIVSDTAKLGHPEMSFGVIPGFGGTQRLPRLIGRTLAMQLILTGDLISPAEAMAMGLVNRVVPQDKLMSSSLALARKILNNPAKAIRLAKQAINVGLEIDYESGCELEATLFGYCFT